MVAYAKILISGKQRQLNLYWDHLHSKFQVNWEYREILSQNKQQQQQNKPNK